MKEIIIGAKRLGTIENGIYISVRKPQHFFIKYNGFGLTENLLEYIKQEGATHVKIRYLGKKGEEIWLTPVENFNYYGTAYYNKLDKQLVLTRKYWEVKCQPQHDNKLRGEIKNEQKRK
jgi:hypothetical protein